MPISCAFILIASYWIVLSYSIIAVFVWMWPLCCHFICCIRRSNIWIQDYIWKLGTCNTAEQRCWVTAPQQCKSCLCCSSKAVHSLRISMHH